MLAFGRCLCFVVIAIDVSDVSDDRIAAADVVEGVLTLLFDVSSLPSPSSPPRCDDDDLWCSCHCCRCCFLRRMSAIIRDVCC